MSHLFYSPGAMESDMMKQLQVSITPEDVCRQNWAAVADIQPSQMCTGDGLTGACRVRPSYSVTANILPHTTNHKCIREFATFYVFI